MGLDLVNIARTGVARVGLARLNAGEVEYSASGDAILSGIAIVIVDPYVVTMTGGADISGSAIPGLEVIAYCDGLSVVQGSISVAIDVTDILSGGSASFAGAATVLWSADYLVTIEGGETTTGGSMYVLADYIPPVSGSSALSGSATFSADFTDALSGGVLLTDGVTGFTIDFTGTISGEAILSGADAASIIEYLASISGAAATAGASGVLADYNAAASGSALTTGTATPFIVEMIGNMGGTATASGGVSNLYADYRDVSAFQGNAEITGTSVVIFTIDVKGLPVYIRRFDGDVRLSLSADGGIIKLRGGQPEMDDGLETAVNISLFSEPDYWGNALSSSDEEIGSTLLSIFRSTLTNQARIDIIEATRTALAWMVSSGIATSIEPTATIPSMGRLDLYIVIRQPEKAPATFRYTVNWKNQEIAMQEAA